MFYLCSHLSSICYSVVYAAYEIYIILHLYLAEYIKGFDIATWSGILEILNKSALWQVESVMMIYWQAYFLFFFQETVISRKGNMVFIFPFCVFNHVYLSYICHLLPIVILYLYYKCDLYIWCSVSTNACPPFVIWLFMQCVWECVIYMVLLLYLAKYINGFDITTWFHMKRYNMSGTYEILNKSASNRLNLQWWYTDTLYFHFFRKLISRKGNMVFIPSFLCI